MAGMTERLSDERLRQLLESQMEWHSAEFVVKPMARELLALREICRDFVRRVEAGDHPPA